MNQLGAQKFSLKKPFMILMFIGMGIGIGRYEKNLIGNLSDRCLSVSTDMKKSLLVVP